MTKKIVYLTPGCFDKGGISRYNRYQIRCFNEMYGDGNVRVLSLFGPDENSFEEIIPVWWHGKTNNVLSKLGMIWKMFWLCVGWRPDLIWIGHVNLSGFAWVISKISMSKTVLNIYGLEVWMKLSADARAGLKQVDYVISDCHNTADYIEQKKVRSTGSIVVIWDCVDLDTFMPLPEMAPIIQQKYNLPDRTSAFVILTLGRLSRDAAYKGYDRLMQVFARLHSLYPQCILVYAGRGDLIPELQQRASELNISQVIHFTGSVDEKDLAALYSYADVFSLVSHQDENSGEGIPLTPLEAMACGLPIIVGNQDGSREAIMNESNGKVIAPFDLGAHYAFFEEMIQDPAKRLEVAKNAIEVANTYFSYDEFKSKHKRFIQSIE